MLETAHHWNRLPSELGICDPSEDKYYMMAYTQSHGEMQSVENYEAEQNAKKKAKG